MTPFLKETWAWRLLSVAGAKKTGVSAYNYIDKDGVPLPGSTNILPAIDGTTTKIEVLAPGSSNKNKLEPLFELKKSTIPGAGNGLFAARQLEYDHIFTYFLGDVDVPDDHRNDYTFSSRTSRTPYSNICYRFAHFCNTQIDVRKNNVTVLNDYTEPEDPNEFMIPPVAHWGVIALRTIEKGEEIFLSYGPGYFDEDMPNERHPEYNSKRVVNPELQKLQPLQPPPSVNRARQKQNSPVCYRRAL